MRFVKETIAKDTKDNYPLLGEFEFRHYPSPRQVKCNELYRDVRIITKVDSSELVHALRAMRSSVTVADVQGNTGAVKIIFTVIKRSDIAHVRELILKYNPQAVYSIEDVRHASDPAFVSEPLPRRSFGSFWRGLRK